MKRNINDLSRIAKAVVAPHTDTGMQASKPMTVAVIDGQLGGQLGRPDMGFFKNRAAKKHDAQLQLETWNKISAEKYRQLGELAVGALSAEARLIREKLKIDFNRQYAALAERAAAGEMEVVRKLEAVLDAGRELLYGDRADAIERLEQRHAAGQLTDEDFAAELGYLFNRYARVLDEFVEIVDERRSGVRTAYRTSTGKPEGVL